MRLWRWGGSEWAFKERRILCGSGRAEGDSARQADTCEQGRRVLHKVLILHSMGLFGDDIYLDRISSYTHIHTHTHTSVLR